VQEQEGRAFAGVVVPQDACWNCDLTKVLLGGSGDFR
jgi:hypothetical protein